MTTLPCPRPLAAGLCLALAACNGAGDSREAPPVQPAGAAAPAVVEAPAEAPSELQTRARLTRELAEEGRSLRVLVEDLRPGERVVLIALEGPGGARVVAGPEEIRSGSRTSGSGEARPRVQLEGGNNDRLGVTLAMDLFSTRPEAREPHESALAWAFLPLPDPAAYAAAPGAWTLQATLQDEVGRSLELSDR
ncbi:MAG: hypothetical protein WD341_11470 [Tistlia sp.]|uniref:hypothetical protein n=1 Tax=Tistlia sp. TaxID=3057121 RepID=UPI0034A1E1ED